MRRHSAGARVSIAGIALAVCMLGVVGLWFWRGGLRVQAQFSPSAGTGPGLPETIEAIDAARVTTSRRQC
jgi:hypothetical protein